MPCTLPSWPVISQRQGTGQLQPASGRVSRIRATGTPAARVARTTRASAPSPTTSSIPTPTARRSFLRSRARRRLSEEASWASIRQRISPRAGTSATRGRRPRRSTGLPTTSAADNWAAPRISARQTLSSAVSTRRWRPRSFWLSTRPSSIRARSATRATSRWAIRSCCVTASLVTAKRAHGSIT